jgi:gas vesicle protein
MLTYLLAFAVALGSLALYLSAFLYPEIHRKGDLVWSGVGLFYALVIWVCAKQITGGLLLGQMAGASLLGWFAWQTVNFRWQENSPAQSLVAGFSLGDLKQRASTGFTQENLTKATGELQTFVSGLSNQVQGAINKSGNQSGNQSGAPSKPSAPSKPDKPLTAADFGNPPVGQSDKPGIFDSLKSLATGGLNSAKNKAAYVRQTAQDKASDLAGKAGDAADKVADTVADQIDDVKAAASDVAAAVGDQVEKVADKTADTAREAANVVADRAEALADGTKSAAAALADATDRATETTVEVVQDAADAVADKLKE